MSKLKLTPCPFCSYDNQEWLRVEYNEDGKFVRCYQCGATGPTAKGDCNDPRLSTKAKHVWNRRVKEKP